jgi:succinate-acetate transporter protein
MSTGTSAADTAAAKRAAPAGAGLLDGDPTALGLPCFIAGSVSFGLAQAGVVPAAAAGAALPVILGFSAVGIFLTTIWAALLGRSAVASVFGVFAGFWLSYSVLLLGITHNWLGISPASVQAAKELYLVVWLVVIVTLTLTTLRLPLIYTAVFFLVDLALLLSFLGVNEGSAGVSKAGGYAALAFAVLGVYLYASTASVATGGRALPLGRPVLR